LKVGDFDVKGRGRGKLPKKFEVALLDEDSTQTQSQLMEVLMSLKKVLASVCTRWKKLKKRKLGILLDLIERQMENRKIISELLQKIRY